ncbi:MAG: phosphoadenosine phosphosulfate reductase family protein [Aquificae bacterium]|nr:phosphoadenosine phosphosulfate reductase family protein [Aquificota bacterium]
MEKIIRKEKATKIAVSYSGGKDSTVLLHLALELAKEKKLKLIIVHSDTLVENPIIHRHAMQTLRKIKKYCLKNKIEIEIKIAKPDPEYTFWVNLIGKGYPLPYHKFRWCQDKLKIKPVKKVLHTIDKAVMFVGLRKDESLDRARSLKKRLEKDFGIEYNGLPTYAPMVDVSEEEVWEFLSNTEPPYDSSYKRVIKIYKEAKGECPLIPDKDNYRSGCGMRFGCWVCTLVREDKTLKNQILENKELKPLYDFRNYMINVCNFPENRSGVRRNGKFVGKGKGVLKLSTRKKLLAKLLNLQASIGKSLISEEEKRLIKKYWKEDKEKFGKIIE